jgi:RNA ligase
MFDNYWPDTVCETRGLITTAEPLYSERIVISRCFRKFFGLGHEGQEDYQIQNLPNTIPTVTEKMDGWFGILWKYKDTNEQLHYGVASRGSFTSPGAIFATNKLSKLIKYGAVEEFPTGYTPIFEIIAKECKVVVDYPFEGLVLLALVNNETGEELPYDNLQSVWAKIAGYSADNRPWIRLVKAHRMTLAECSAHEEKNVEGFVLSYPRPGTYPIKVKVKLEEYKKLHKLITGITPQQIWRSLNDPMAEWLIGVTL